MKYYSFNNIESFNLSTQDISPFILIFDDLHLCRIVFCIQVYTYCIIFIAKNFIFCCHCKLYFWTIKYLFYLDNYVMCKETQLLFIILCSWYAYIFLSCVIEITQNNTVQYWKRMVQGDVLGVERERLLSLSLLSIILARLLKMFL